MCELGTIPLQGAESIAEAIAVVSAYDSIHPYISVFLCVTGTIMNIITVAVLTRPTMRSPVNILLSAVAICDIIVMSSVFVFVSHFQLIALKRCDPSDFTLNWAIFMYVHAQTSVIFHATSIWLTVLLAQIRVLTIRRATKLPTEALSVRATALISFITLAIVVAVNVPNFMTTEIANYTASEFLSCVQESENGTAILPDHASLPVFVAMPSADCDLFQLALWTNGLFFKVVPCAMLTVSIIALLRIISDVAHRRRSLAQLMNKKKVPRDHTTPMLVAVLSIFLLAELPQGVLHIGKVVFTHDTFHQTIYQPLGNLMDLLSLVNSAVNFIIYCAMSRKFRVVFIQMISPCIPSCFNYKCQYGTDFDLERSQRPSAITDYTKTEQLALTSQRASTSSTLHPSQAAFLSRLHSGYLDGGASTATSAGRSSFLQVPGASSARMSFDDRTHIHSERSSSLAIHELSLRIPELHEPRHSWKLRDILPVLRPIRSVRSFWSRVRHRSSLVPNITLNSFKQEMLSEAIQSSPERRISNLRIECVPPPGM
ncbi:hypothetical protein PFISCL1PPCAC_1259 [Pristionchus fissidentatus]|uniref:G-protein coupled receptors family 1 profile domain-containing protein n=1 Tax=Pristionchus fissidentatus TaxID=1538716 RepID=A0AAV5UTQ4_9BILA|nr:hypothetical protein PFISCL1PPCAC_1259 [Pristionchus fissidentatus]